MPKQSIEQRLEAMLEWQGNDNERTLHLLYGELPEWFPLPILERARRIVNALLGDEFTSEQIALFATNAMADKFTVPGIVRDPAAFIRAVDELGHIKYALSLPENGCLEMLAGEKSVKGKQFSSGGSNKKSKEYEPKASIRKICEHIQSSVFEDVLTALQDADLCADLYESTSDPIRVLFTAVDEDLEVIVYLPRGRLPDSPKKIGFKRLRGILTEIKK